MGQEGQSIFLSHFCIELLIIAWEFDGCVLFITGSALVDQGISSLVYSQIPSFSIGQIFRSVTVYSLYTYSNLEHAHNRNSGSCISRIDEMPRSNSVFTCRTRRPTFLPAGCTVRTHNNPMDQRLQHFAFLARWRQIIPCAC